MNQRFLAVLILATAAINPAASAPISFNTALPVGKGNFINREQVVIHDLDDSSAERRDLQVDTLISVLAYGISAKLALFAALPYLKKDLRITAGGEDLKRSSTGLGDMKLFGRYTLYQNDMRGRTFRVAGFAGVKLPTGRDAETDALGILPASLQPGSGSRDQFAGLVMTYQTLDFQLDGQLAYGAPGNSNDFKAGDETRLDLSFQYRVWPQHLSAETPGFFMAYWKPVFLIKPETGSQECETATLAAPRFTSLLVSNTYPGGMFWRRLCNCRCPRTDMALV